MRAPFALTVAVAAAAIASPAPAAPPDARALALGNPAAGGARTLSRRQVEEAVRREGLVSGPAVVDDDLDLAHLAPPRSAHPQIRLSTLTLRGRLLGTPRFPLRIEGGSLCELGSRSDGAAWPSVVLVGVKVARLTFKGRRVDGSFACLGCSVCRADFFGARFEGDATFVGETTLGVPVEPNVCSRTPPRECPRPEFSEATFRGIARFDGARFEGGAGFANAEFQASARFPAVTSPGSLDLVGARFADEAEFRDCTVGGLEVGRPAFAPAPPPAAPPGERRYVRTVFAGRADFRGCVVSGPARFDHAVFLADASLARAEVRSDEVSFRGALATRPVDLRGLRLRADRPRLLLDPPGAEAVRLRWADLGNAVLEGAKDLPDDEPAATLEALAARLRADGAPGAAREAEFEAKRWRAYDDGAPTWGAHLLARAQWCLWTLPTRNGGDPTIFGAMLLLLWGAWTLGTAGKGRLVVLPRTRDDAPAPAVYAPLVRTIGAVFPEGSHSVVGPARWLAALRFATALVLKLGGTPARWVPRSEGGGAGIAGAALVATWVLAWPLVFAFLAAVTASFPGLTALMTGA